VIGGGDELAGLTSPLSQAHDIRLKRGDTMAYSNSRNILPSDVDPAHTYGRANRPSTPVADVIQVMLFILSVLFPHGSI